MCSLTMVSNIQLQNLQVLLDGLGDSESKLSKLMWPNDVRSPVMKMIWDMVTEDWQVISNYIDDP